MDYKDYYKILGLTKSATADEIKRAYRKLARQFHPDKNKAKGAEDRFKEVNEANEVLSDPKKRQAYDQLGANWRAGERFSPPPGWTPGGAGGFGGGGSAGFGRAGPSGRSRASDFGGFSDFFSTLFGNAGAGADAGGFGGSFEGAGGAQVGQDSRAKLTISLEDSFNGATKTINLGNRSLNVKIPKGVTTGQTIRLAGQVAGGGDVLLEIELAAHPVFRLDGRDIHVLVSVAPWEAALGGKVPVPTLGGTVELALPAGSQGGKKMRLKGRGMPGTNAGDQIVSLQIVTPPALTDEDRAFYTSMAKQFDFDPRAIAGA